MVVAAATNKGEFRAAQRLQMMVSASSVNQSIAHFAKQPSTESIGLKGTVANTALMLRSSSVAAEHSWEVL